MFYTNTGLTSILRQFSGASLDMLNCTCITMCLS